MRLALPSRSGARLVPTARIGILPAGGRGRRLLAHLLTVALAASVLTIGSLVPASPSAALAVPPLPPFPIVPPPAAGAVSVGAASTGIGGVGTAVGAAGASIVLPPLVAAAGFVAGYQAASLLCGATNTFGGVCADYQAPSVPVSGLASSSAPCTFTYNGTLRSHYCETYSWSTLLDTGTNLNNSVPIRLQLDPVSPVFTPDGVEIPDGSSLAPGIGCWWGASQGLPTYPSQCGQSLNPNLAPPSRYGPGQVRWPRESNPAQDGRLNGHLEPGDQIIIRVGNDAQVQGVVAASPEVNARGGEYRFKAYLQCKSGNNTNNYTRTGAWGSQANPPTWPDVTCPTGYPMALQVDWEQYRRVFTPRAGGWYEYGGIPLRNGLYVSWQAPPEILTDSRLRSCYETQDCVLTETVQGDPSTCQWGGAAAPAAYCSSTREALQEANPPTPTTTTPTTVPPTTAPPGTSIPPPGPPPEVGPPPAPEDGDFGFGSCVSDYVSEGSDGVNLNPVTWVRAVLYYIAGPVVCALFWAFVPPGGWSAAISALMEPINESPVLVPLRSLFTAASSVTGCAPVDFAPPGVDGSWVIDVGMCGNPVLGALWVLLIGLAVLGLAKSVISSVATFRKHDPVGPDS